MNGSDTISVAPGPELNEQPQRDRPGENREPLAAAAAAAAGVSVLPPTLSTVRPAGQSAAWW